jgi:hypothetical protein
MYTEPIVAPARGQVEVGGRDVHEDPRGERPPYRLARLSGLTAAQLVNARNGIRRSKHLTDADKLLWWSMAGFATKTGRCFASFETLADDTNWTVAKVKRIHRNLAKAGAIYPEGKHGWTLTVPLPAGDTIPDTEPGTPKAERQQIISDLTEAIDRSIGVFKAGADTRRAEAKVLDVIKAGEIEDRAAIAEAAGVSLSSVQRVCEEYGMTTTKPSARARR